jgi:FkbM family methyltransferase
MSKFLRYNYNKINMKSNQMELSENNLSFTDRLFGSYKSLKNKIMWFNYYRKTYRKFFTVLRNDLQDNYPFEANLNSGERVMLNSRDKTALFALLSVHKNIEYDSKNDAAILTYHLKKSQEKKIKLYGLTQNLDAILVFSEESTYANLPMDGRTIIDIGACTADTSIFFVLHGAKRVIAIEPYPKNFEMARKNVETNNFQDKIEVILGACGSAQRSIMVDPNYSSSMRSSLVESAKGTIIPVITLEQILEKYNVNDPVLKMDCEGCEYEVILSTSETVLQKFSYIQIEYHRGYNDLKKKLEKARFKVSRTIVDTTHRGHIVAERINP